GWLEGKDFPVMIHEITDNEWSGKGWKIQTGPVKHNPESIAYRLEADSGKVVVYTGDTGYSESLIELARGADLLISECSFPDAVDLPAHLNPSKVGRIARLAGVKKVLLTHLYPPCDEVDIVKECGREFEGEIIKSEDGMVVEIN
ncbi:MAG TPA: MBL fold metallo-hydrolase, partial [Proteobacteria bacterium]|nr:MBL fold metallo-hydrolase [Pseudomonadota bacterium]